MHPTGEGVPGGGRERGERLAELSRYNNNNMKVRRKPVPLYNARDALRNQLSDSFFCVRFLLIIFYHIPVAL